MHKQGAFTLVEVLIVVVILGFLVGIAAINVMKSKEGVQDTACQGNMVMIESAIEQWALDNNVSSSTNVAANESNWDDYLRHGALPNCPDGGAYSYTGAGTSGTVGDYKLHCSVHGDVD